jgi:hypothetical protein
MKKSHIIGGVVAVIVIVLLIIGFAPKKSAAPGRRIPVLVEKDGMKTYTETDFGFSVQYPSDWVLEDRLTSKTCCLFIAHIVTSTTTDMVATGTPATSTPRQTVVQKELIKLQIGVYDRKIADPFTSSTTPIVMNGKTLYRGYTSTGEFFLIPRDQQTGIGAGEFRYIETPQADIDAAQKAISSITFVGRPTATINKPTSTSTSATSTPSKATNTKK